MFKDIKMATVNSNQMAEENCDTGHDKKPHWFEELKRQVMSLVPDDQELCRRIGEAETRVQLLRCVDEMNKRRNARV